MKVTVLWWSFLFLWSTVHVILFSVGHLTSAVATTLSTNEVVDPEVYGAGIEMIDGNVSGNYSDIEIIGNNNQGMCRPTFFW